MSRSVCLFLLALAGSLHAQSPGVSMRIATETGQGQYRIGEAIALTLTIDNSSEEHWMLTINGRDRPIPGLETDVFLVSPSAGTSDPMRYRFGQPVAGSILGGFLPEKTSTMHTDLNQWVRFEKPGFYRVHGLFHARSPGGSGQIALESNDIGIEIVAADPAWQARQLSEAVDTINSLKQDNSTFDQIMNAARQIGYLDTPDSIRQAATLLGTAGEQVSQILRTWLEASAHPDVAIAAMKQLLGSPDQPVPPVFLETLTSLEAGKHWEARANIATQLRSELTQAMEKKQGRAKAVSMKTLLDSTPVNSTPPVSRDEAARLFSQLPPGQQSELLGSQWPQIAGPEMIPVLRKIYDALPDTPYPHQPLAASAVERLYQLDPVQGRAVILDEMRRPEPRLPFATLAILPDKTLPDMDSILTQRLAQNRPDTELIARYATSAILQPVKAYYAKRAAAGPFCDAPLVAYFLRSDPAWGDRVLRELLASHQGARVDGCRMGILGRTAAYYISPEWEKAAVETLQDGVVDVRADAVKSLGEHGSPASEAPVWEAFRYWHEWWKDRRGELSYERRLEQTFLEAIAHAKNWNITPADLEKARSLCISQDCASRADEYLRQWMPGQSR
jgi:hypothetical protein